MLVRVRLPDDSLDDLVSLHNWLADEPAVRRHGELHADTTQPPAGQMGVVEVLSLVIGSGLSLAQLVLAIVGWRASRRRPCRVLVEVPGRTIEVETNDPDEALAIVRSLETG